MNILIANYELENFFGGTQTWTITMKKAFERLGHYCDITALIPGINQKFREYIRPLRDEYDLLIANGNQTLCTFMPKAKKKVFVSHGVLPKLEQPVPGANFYLAVSEEVSNNIESKGFECSGIIRNPVNTGEFHFTKINKNLQTIAFLDRRRKFPFLKQAKKEYKVIEVGNPPVYDMFNALVLADLVVARGRGIYEAMSMGKNVIVSGNNSGRAGADEIMDGYVDETSFFEFRKNNCSGRNQHIQVVNWEQFKEELNKYDSVQGEINRQLIKNQNNDIGIANQILNLL